MAIRLAAEAVAAQDAAVREREQAERAARADAERAAAAPQMDSVKSEADRAADEAALAREAERRRANEEAEAKSRRDGLNRMNQLLGRVEALMQKEDLSLKASDRALRDVRAALADVPPLPSRQDFEHVSTPQGRAGSARAARPRPARSRRVAAMGQRRHPGTALREDGSAPRRHRSRSDRAPHPRAAAAVAAGRRRAASARRVALEAFQGRARRAVGALRSALRGPGRSARGQPHQESRALRAADALRTRTTADGRRDRPGAVEGDRPGHAGSGKGDLGTVLRGVRQVFHPAAGRLAKRKKLWAENFAKKKRSA